MFLSSLELFNFRNYENFNLEFKKKKTIIIGENAIGKTNILESVFFISTLDSFRAKADKELIMIGKDFSRVKGNLTKFDTEVELDVWINPPKRKLIKINGIKKSKYSEFINTLSVVKFGVDDLLLMRGAPADRRKWIDIAISQIYPAYIDRLSKYNKIKEQKNNLLKSFKGNIYNEDNEVLGVFNEQLSVCGANIIYLRQKYLKEILEESKKVHKKISNKNEELDIKYQCSLIGENKFDELEDIQKIKELFDEKIKEKTKEEIIRAKAVVGPHRDDILFFINDINSLQFASQGQQRTVVLSLKMAEIDLLKTKINETPLLLLDDVLAELDGDRQNYLLESINDDIQTIITSTDINNFKKEFLTEDVEVINLNNDV